MQANPQKRIVLRRKPAFYRSLASGPLATAHAGNAQLAALSEPVVELAELNDKEVADLHRSPDIAGIATAMPLKLIQPFDNGAQPSAAGSSWGIEAVGAHTSAYSGEGVVVAVLDTGILPTHAAFQGVHLVRRNFTTGPEDDVEGHGTHCAGTIFGRDVGGVRIGVARGVNKALIGKVLGPGGGSSAQLSEAIQWAYANGANVISMSLGIDFAGYVAWLVEQQGVEIEAATSMALEQYRANVKLFSSLTSMLEQSNAFSQAAVIVAAAGNESNRPRYEVAVSPPAAGDGMIAVGALGRSVNGGLQVANFSNTQCNLCGPGVDITSAWIGGAQALKSISGTSMATPHVAGCVALWAQHLKQTLGAVSGVNLAARTLSSAVFVPGQAYDDIGNGMVQAPR